MPELEIIGAPQSNYVCAVRIACREKGVSYTLVPARPHSPEVDAVHPFGKIPAMRHGEVTLCESRAIYSYIDNAFPGPPLLPREPVAAARAEQWISLVNTAIDPVLPEMERHFALLDGAVAATGHLVGDGLTLADINLLPILFYMDKLPESGAMLRQATHLDAYFRRHAARPSFQEAAPPPFPGRQG